MDKPSPGPENERSMFGHVTPEMIEQANKDANGEPIIEDIKGESAADRFRRAIDAATDVSIVNDMLDEANADNLAVDAADRLGIERQRVFDYVGRRNILLADRLIQELGLDGKAVFADPDKEHAMMMLVGSTVRESVARNAIEIEKAGLQKLIQESEKKIAAQEANLAREQADAEVWKAKLFDESAPPD